MLTQLREIVEQVTAASTLEEAMAILVSQTRETMGTDCCSVYLTDESRQVFTLTASEGLAAEAVGHAAIAFNEGVVGLVAQKEEPLNLADAHSHPRFKYLPDSQEEAFRAFLGAPIIHQRNVLGVLVVQQKQRRQFDKGEESFLVTLAAQLATVIAHSETKGLLSTPRKTRTIKSLKGIAGSPGVAIAQAYVVLPQTDLSQIKITTSQDIDFDLALLEKAIINCTDEIKTLAFRLKEQLPKETLAIFDIYTHMLAKASMGGEIVQQIRQGYDAPSAVKLTAENYISQFQAMSDPYLRERSSDVKDVSQRLLTQLSKTTNSLGVLPDQLIMVAEEVSATMLAEMPREKLVGIVSVKGSANSHAAILARAMGIPALMGMELPIEKLADKLLVIDGYSGELYVSPEQAILNEYISLQAQELELDSLMKGSLDAEAVTRDGVKVEMLLNAGLSADTEIAINTSADGVGLYRTEIPFMLTDSFPTEEEQEQRYHGILATYKDKPVTMRTLDVGGDKQLPYFSIVEENPFLGWRGIRLTLDHPEIFLVQIKAMLRASIGLGNLQIMLPMISGLEEVNESIRLIDQAWCEIKLEHKSNSAILVKPKLGVMIEVPSSLFILPELAKKVDFWSIGSNDLTQYLLAVDRNNARVADIFDSFHPAVLRALAQIVGEANKYKIPLSLCGELAGDPLGAVVLLGMGYTRLSMNTYNIAKIKYVIRHVEVSELKVLLNQALQSGSGVHIRSLFAAYLEKQGLGGLVRAGK